MAFKLNLTTEEVLLTLLAVEAERASCQNAYNEDKAVIKELGEYEGIDPNYWREKVKVLKRVEKKLREATANAE